MGESSGYVPYTAFSAKKSYIENNPEIIQSFTNALQKGMDYVGSHTPEEIATVIAPQFDGTQLQTITTIVSRYAAQDTWKENLIFEEDSFMLLQNILEEAGELPERVPYEALVTTEFAEQAIKSKHPLSFCVHPYRIYPDDEMSIFLMIFHHWGAFATSLIYYKNLIIGFLSS